MENEKRYQSNGAAYSIQTILYFTDKRYYNKANIIKNFILNRERNLG